MLCPACKDRDMFVLEFRKVEVDYCCDCGGVWLDSGELALIAERSGGVETRLLSALETPAEPRKGPGARRCPLCRRRLQQVVADTSPPVTVDRCPGEHGLWFDRGELAAIVHAAGADGNGPLAQFFASLGDRNGEAGNT